MARYHVGALVHAVASLQTSRLASSLIEERSAKHDEAAGRFPFSHGSEFAVEVVMMSCT